MSVVPIVHVSDAEVILGSWHNLVVWIWHGTISVAAVIAFEGQIARIAAGGKRGVAVLAVIEEDAPLPTTEVRSALVAALRRSTGKMQAYAVLYEGTGFTAAAVRSVVSSVGLLVRPAFPYKVLGRIEDACGWIAPHLKAGSNQGISAEDLAQGVRMLRRQAEARRS
jgi:hypothetical protein